MGTINEMLLKRMDERNTLSEDKKSPPPGQTVEGNTKESSSLKSSFSDTIIIPEKPQKVKSFRCNIDKIAYTNKDEAKKKTGAIVNRMKSEQQVTATTAKLLAEAVTKGFSFTAAALKGTKEADFISQQLLVADIDNEREDIPETTVDEAIMTLNNHRIDYAFMYYSFSHSTIRPKFRIVCVLDEPITDPARAKLLNQYFISLFPQADKTCFNLDRFYYGTDKGLATEVYNRTTTIDVPAEWKSEPPSELLPEQEQKSDVAPSTNEYAPPISANEATAKPQNGDNFDLTQAIRSFNLLEYVEQTTGTKGKQHGKDILFNPCPICGHQDDFYIDPKKNLFKCHSSHNGTGGNIINYIEQKHPDFDRKAAREYFIYDILKRDRNAGKSDYKKAKRAEEKQKAESRTGIDGDYDYYIKDGGLKCPLLAEYFSKKFNYIFVQDSAKDTVQRYIYSDGYYKLSSDDNFKRIIKNLIPLNLQTKQDINEVFYLVSIDHDFIKRSQINADENIINFKNGVLHLDTMTLKPHSPDYLCTKRIPCNYIHNAQKPLTGHFERYMKHLTAGSASKASLIMQFLGMAISNIRGYRTKKSLFMTGEGDTGKSVIRSLAAYLVGEENNSGITLETLEARFGTSIIYGKRLVGSADMSFMTVKELSAFKQITGGDPIFAEFKGENGFTYEFDGVVWFCMNKLPKFGGDKGEHVYERMVIVECNPNKPETLDSKLQEKLRTEADYIVSLAIKELKKVIDNDYKYIIPQSVKDAKEYYKIQNNSFLQFFEECTTERPAGKIIDNCTTKRFYDVYAAWCKDNNNGHTETKQAVNKLLQDMGKDEQKKIKGIYYWSEFTLTLAAKKDYYGAYGHDDTTNVQREQGE